MPYKAGGGTGGCLILIAVLVVLVFLVKAAETHGSLPFFVGGIAIAAALISFRVYRSVQRKKEIHRLLDKYGDLQIANRILNKTIWKGETEAQLIDSFGAPASVDRQSLELPDGEIWTYERQGKTKSPLWIALKEGKVSKWERPA